MKRQDKQMTGCHRQRLKSASIAVRSAQHCILIFGMVFGAAACTTEAMRIADGERAQQMALKALIAAGDADSLAAAALYSTPPLHPVSASLELMERAATLAPDRADIAWLQMSLCYEVKTCDPTAAEQSLQRLDPDNAAGWHGALTRAQQAKDTAAIDAVIAKMASKQRFDIYWNPTIARLSRAVVETKSLDPRSAISTTIGFLAAKAIPAYQSISNYCKGDRLRDEKIRSVCQSLGAVMSNGDTYITEMIGNAIARRSWAIGTTEYTRAVEAKRVAHYRMQVGNGFAVHALRTRRAALEYLQFLEQHRREQDVLLLAIRREGKTPDPPADWVDN